jgi:hypothetical protein
LAGKVELEVISSQNSRNFFSVFAISIKKKAIGKLMEITTFNLSFKTKELTVLWVVKWNYI